MDLAPDIILSDYNLPQFSATHALQLLGERCLDIPFIIVSGSIGEEVAVQAIKQGASDYLLKDRLVRLGSAVSQALKEREFRKARKRTEEALHAAQMRLHHVVSTSPAVLFTLAIEVDSFSLVWLSENVQQMTGYSVEEALQPNWWYDRVHPEDSKDVTAQIKHAFFAKGTLAQEYRFRHRDGKYRWVRSELKLLRDHDDLPFEIVGSWSDITERKLLEEQYRQAQKMEAFGQLAGGVAHDFNNLLTVITGFSEMLLSGAIPAEKQHDAIREIRKAGNRAASLTRQLLAFSRKQVLQPVELNLNAVVADTEKMLRRLIGEDIDLATSLDPALGSVKADSGQIEQVIMNLVVNARDAMPTGGHLTIETQNVELDQSYAQNHAGVQPGKYVMLAVADSGCGMDEGTRARIFEPFFTTKEVNKGTGLGLATVHGIVKQSGGSIEVYSEVGHGTTFKIYLPRLKGALPSSKSSPGFSVIPCGTETILLAEDEEGVRASVRISLESNGYSVLARKTGMRPYDSADNTQGRSTC